MLARTFKTAAELGITEHEANALQTVLYMLEDGEIKAELFDMTVFEYAKECGTAHCLAGWAHSIDRSAFPEIGIGRFARVPQLIKRLPAELSALFGLENSNWRIQKCGARKKRQLKPCVTTWRQASAIVNDRPGLRW